MKIKQISYHNYRCFLDDTFDFAPNSTKNVALIIGPNTCGKTEMLVSMMWVLYGYNFDELEGNKPLYSLNQDLHDKLDVAPLGTQESCSVEMVFESDGLIYTVTRTELFTKGAPAITSQQSLSLRHTNSNGTTSLAITDVDKVLDELSRVIPPNIMDGIMFDGERMKKLNSSDKKAKDTVQGVVSQVCNQVLLESIKFDMNSVKDALRAQRTRLSRAAGNTSITQLDTRIKSLEGSVRINKQTIEKNTNTINELKARLEAIHLELAQNRTSQELEKRRNQLQDQISEKKKELEKAVDTFYKDLDEGFFLICEPLFAGVKGLLEQSNVPAGLTVEAVDSILAKGTCICGCGHPLTPKERENLLELRKQLPPENINSTLAEMVRYNELRMDDVCDKLARSYEPIEGLEEERDSLRTQINNISNLLSTGASEVLRELELERQQKQTQLEKLQSQNKSLSELVEDNNKSIAELIEKRKQSSESSEILRQIEVKEGLIGRYMDAIDKMSDLNQTQALADINKRLDKAYSQLSEDYQNGRRIYIVQYDPQKRYSLVAYNIDNRKNVIERHEKEIATLRAIGAKEEEIEERIILWMSKGSSTGQTTINTLAFSHAVLSYANQDRSTEAIEISKSYPLLIDSPFSNISNDNLKQAAAHLHEFAEQVILLTTKKDYSSVEDYIKPYVSTTIELTKKK